MGGSISNESGEAGPGPMPFDRAETILRLRERLFTRIKDEDSRRGREFHAQNPRDDFYYRHPERSEGSGRGRRSFPQILRCAQG
jgi:hypothetical protein